MGRLAYVVIGGDALACVLQKKAMMPRRGEQHPKVAIAEVMDIRQRPAVRPGALTPPVPRPLTASHLELGEHPTVVLACVEPLGDRSGDIEEVATGNVPDRQLLDKAFQRGGFPLVLR